ncbi:MAG: hypothetical protein LDL14_04435, partial [Nitrospira sp.]|nr:hypothetical protein [Nitrospira sp.]
MKRDFGMDSEQKTIDQISSLNSLRPLHAGAEGLRFRRSGRAISLKRLLPPFIFYFLCRHFSEDFRMTFG